MLAWARPDVASCGCRYPLLQRLRHPAGRSRKAILKAGACARHARRGDMAAHFHPACCHTLVQTQRIDTVCVVLRTLFIRGNLLLSSLHLVDRARSRERRRARKRYAPVFDMAVLLYQRAGLTAAVRQKVTPFAPADAVACPQPHAVRVPHHTRHTRQPRHAEDAPLCASPARLVDHVPRFCKRVAGPAATEARARERGVNRLEQQRHEQARAPCPVPVPGPFAVVLGAACRRRVSVPGLYPVMPHRSRCCSPARRPCFLCRETVARVPL